MATNKVWIKKYDISEQYEIIDRVGRGTYGTVFKVKSLIDKKQYAIKKLENNDPKIQGEGFPITALRQIILLKHVDHPNIIKLKEILISKPNKRNLMRGSTFLVFQYMEHDLSGFLKNKIWFSLPQIKCIAKQLLEGVNYLHKQNLMHRDIKSANILMGDKGDIKLADFGLGRKCKFQGLYTYKVVTLWYRAPQLILGCKSYDYKVDMWSVGCVLAQFFIHDILFKKQNDCVQLQRILQVLGDFQKNNVPSSVLQTMSLYKQIVPQNRSFQNKFEEHFRKLCPQITDDALSLLKGLLDLNPKTRLSCQQALKHPFFTNQPLPCPKSEIKKLDFEYHQLNRDTNNKIERQEPKPKAEYKNQQYYKRKDRDYGSNYKNNYSKYNRVQDDRDSHRRHREQKNKYSNSSKSYSSSSQSGSSISSPSSSDRRSRDKRTDGHKNKYYKKSYDKNSTQRRDNRGHYNNRHWEKGRESSIVGTYTYDKQRKQKGGYRHQRQESSQKRYRERHYDNKYDKKYSRKDKEDDISYNRQDNPKKRQQYFNPKYQRKEREEGDKEERIKKYEKPQKYERPDKYQRPEKYERPQKYERTEKYERPEKYEGTDKFYRFTSKSEKQDKFASFRNEKQEKYNKYERQERYNKYERNERLQRNDEGDRKNRQFDPKYGKYDKYSGNDKRDDKDKYRSYNRDNRERRYEGRDDRRDQYQSRDKYRRQKERDHYERSFERKSRSRSRQKKKQNEQAEY